VSGGGDVRRIGRKKTDQHWWKTRQLGPCAAGWIPERLRTVAPARHAWNLRQLTVRLTSWSMPTGGGWHGGGPSGREKERSPAPARPRAGWREGPPRSRARRARAESAGRERSLPTSGRGRGGSARGEARPRSAEHSPGRPLRPAIPAPAREEARLRW